MAPQAVFGRPGVTFPPGDYARLRPVDAGTVAFESTYHTALVNDFKQSVPFQYRRWDSANKRWLIEPSYAPICADLAEQYLGVRPAVPQVLMPTQAPVEQRLVRLDYLGRCKERVPGEDPTASGWADGKWSLVFSESVLRAWFEPGIAEDTTPAPAGKPPTFYALLSVKATSTADEIKSAYRRLARSLHPDVNKEPDAAERFIQVKDAYDVLMDDQKRRRYDAGLAFEAASVAQDPYVTHYDYRQFSTPLRCGWVLVEGQQRFGGFHVSQILGWEDVIREDGLVMVTSWPAGDKHFRTDWVEP